MKRKATRNYQATQEDIRARYELQTALMQASQLPPPDQWGFTLEIMPDWALAYVLRARAEPPEILMERLGPLGMDILQARLGETNGELLMMAMYGLTLSAAAELERRYQEFCIEIAKVEDPFEIAASEDLPFTPKNAETFSLDTLMRQYAERFPFEA